MQPDPARHPGRNYGGGRRAPGPPRTRFLWTYVRWISRSILTFARCRPPMAATLRVASSAAIRGCWFFNPSRGGGLRGSSLVFWGNPLWLSSVQKAFNKNNFQ